MVLSEQFNGFLQDFLFLYKRLIPFFYHLNDPHKYFQELSIEADKLRKSIATVKAQVYDQVGKGKQCRTEVKDWLDRAGAAEKDVENIKTKYERSGKFLKWWVMSHHERHELRKLAAEKLEEIREIDRQACFDEFTDAVPVSDTIIDIPSAPLHKREDQVCEVVTKVVECLKDGENSIIGVYGGEEIGSIAFAQQIQCRIQGFDLVFGVKVSKEPDLLEIQMSIARDLDLSLPEIASRDEIAGSISTWLEQKKHLIILEDVWSELDLNQHGIPKPTNKLGSKIVVVTPLEKVCDEMEIPMRLKVSH